MSFKHIHRCILCILLFSIVQTIEVNAQTTQLVKSTRRWVGRKVIKEGVEEVAEQSTKVIAKEITEKTITNKVGKAISESSTTITQKSINDVKAVNIKNTLTTRVGSELSETALKTVGKEFAEQIGKSVTKESQDYFVKRLGTESSQQIFELSGKESMQASSINIEKSWTEILKDKYHQLRISLLQKVRKSKTYSEMLDIYAKGPISLTNKEITELLTHPEYFRTILKIKTGKKGNVIEFLVRLKMSNPQHVKQILDNPELLSYVKKSIRANKGVHEWLMVKNVEDFLLNPKWGSEGDFLAVALPKLTQKTDNVLFKIGGKHGSENSARFHNGLSKVIGQSSSIEELFVNIRRYAKKNLTPDAYNEFLKILEQTLEAA